MNHLSRRLFVALPAIAALVTTAPLARAEEEVTWGSLKSDVFGSRGIEDANGAITLTAPYRAEDAAIVPIDIALKPGAGVAGPFKSMTLIVDENPSPVVAKFAFGEANPDMTMSVRVRVNSYSYVRVIAETMDGRLVMAKTYVKAAGGCSAPAGKDPAEALNNVGKMKFRIFADQAGSGLKEAQFQIRHPNNSGLQVDQVTHLFIPPWFVKDLTVKQGEDVLFRMEGGISISEDPTFRFSYRSTGKPFVVEAIDTEDKIYRGTFEARQGS